MRKTVEILLCILTVLLLATAFVSCRAAENRAGRKAAAVLAGAFSCTADVTVDGRAYTVNIIRLADGSSTVQFLKPAELAQLSFLSGKDGLRVRYGNMQAQVDVSAVPQSAVFNAVLGAFDAAVKSGGAARQDKSTVLKGQSNAGAFTLVFDAAGRPQSLQISRLDLSAAIHDFTVN